MAGLIKTDVQHNTVVPAITEIVARCCPHDDAYGRACVRYDGHYGYIAVCPFWFGTELYQGNGVANVRCPDKLRDYLAQDRPGMGREYKTLCLKAGSSGLAAGAKLRM